MSKLMNIKGLLITFGVLVVILVIVRISDSKKGDRSFKSDLASVTLEELHEMLIYPKGETNTPVNLLKKDDLWRVSQHGNEFKADQNAVSGLARELDDMVAERVVANKKDQWSRFEVNDSLGTRVVAKSDDDVLVDIYIGKFSYQQPANTGAYNPYQRQQGIMTTYVRLKDEKDVYAVNGFLSASFNRSIDQLRDHMVTNGTSGNWTKITVNHPGDSSFVMEKTGDVWKINSLECDSASAVEYIHNLGSIRGNAFVPGSSQGAVVHDMTIEGSGLNAPIHITASEQNGKQTIESSLNTGNIFDGTQGDLFTKIFTKRPKVKA